MSPNPCYYLSLKFKIPILYYNYFDCDYVSALHKKVTFHYTSGATFSSNGAAKLSRRSINTIQEVDFVRKFKL